METIPPSKLVPMDLFAGAFPLRTEVAYTRADAFCGAIYHKNARLWLHEDMAKIVLMAARLCHERNGLQTVLYDGLRTVEAQDLMMQSSAVRAHPQWLAEETRVLAPPGIGGHPRGMAIDLGLETADGILLDMGTAFDALPVNGSGPDVNRAHREFAALPENVKRNRSVLDEAMADAARAFGLPLLPLPVEWWDFRFPASYANDFAPFHDADLPSQMRMTAASLNLPGPMDFPEAHFTAMKDRLCKAVDSAIPAPSVSRSLSFRQP